MGRKGFRIREKGSGMKYITEALEIQEDFPLVVSIGSGFSREEEQSGRAVMHNHHSLEINYCLEGEGRYLIGDDQYPIFPGDVFIINNLEYHRAVNEDGRLKLLVIVFDADLVLLNSEDYSYIRAFYEWKQLSGTLRRLYREAMVSPSTFREKPCDGRDQSSAGRDAPGVGGAGCGLSHGAEI